MSSAVQNIGVSDSSQALVNRAGLRRAEHAHTIICEVGLHVGDGTAWLVIAYLSAPLRAYLRALALVNKDAPDAERDPPHLANGIVNILREWHDPGYLLVALIKAAEMGPVVIELELDLPEGRQESDLMIAEFQKEPALSAEEPSSPDETPSPTSGSWEDGWVSEAGTTIEPCSQLK